jgi:NADH-quinone oxidoreductase subunit J
MTELGTGDIGLIQNLGNVLFKEYVVPFEISSILFLSAMVGAVVIGKRDGKTPGEKIVEKESKRMHETREAMNINDII